jgi:hypothetical protein
MLVKLMWKWNLVTQMMGLTSKERRIKTMKVELKQIIDELTDAINLPKGQKVSAIIDTDKIVGWTIVEVHEDGSIKPISDKKFNNLKGLISEYK